MHIIEIINHPQIMLASGPHPRIRAGYQGNKPKLEGWKFQSLPSDFLGEVGHVGVGGEGMEKSTANGRGFSIMPM